MTRNQILFQELQQRKVRDQRDYELGLRNVEELGRHNSVVEQETERHNLVVEGQALQQLQLNERAVTAQERNAASQEISANATMLNAQTNREALEINRYNAETNRLNYAVNLMNAETNARNAATNERNAATNERNAESQRIAALAAQSQAGAAWANAQTNARMADITASYNAGLLEVQQMNANTNARMADAQISNYNAQAALNLEKTKNTIVGRYNEEVDLAAKISVMPTSSLGLAIEAVDPNFGTVWQATAASTTNSSSKPKKPMLGQTGAFDRETHTWAQMWTPQYKSELNIN